MMVVAVVQMLSCVRCFATPWTAARQASLSFTISQNLLNLMSAEPVMLCNHLTLCCPFSSCPQSFPASSSFPMSWLFASGGQSIGASALASVFPVNLQGWLPLRLTSLLFPSLGDLPDPGIEPGSLKSPALAGVFFTTGTTWEAHNDHNTNS